MTSDDFEWRFWGQVKDVALLATGIALLFYEAVFRDPADRLIIIAALCCVGFFAGGKLLSWARNGKK